MPQQVLNARALKCTVVLDAAEVAQLVAPDGQPRVVVAIRLPDRRLSVDLAAKSVRKAVAMLAEHGPDGVAVIIQGRLAGGDALTDAGIVAQPKVRPQATPSRRWTFYDEPATTATVAAVKAFLAAALK